MIQYERIDNSEGIDPDKTNGSLKCMICGYYYFKNTGFKYQPYVYYGCHDFNMVVKNLSDFLILKIKNVDHRCYLVGFDKKDAISSLNNSVINNKGVF